MGFHVIGVGSLGSLIATHLRTTLPAATNVTLIVKRPQYSVTGASFGPFTEITVHRMGIPMTAKGFKWEVVADGSKGFSTEGANQSNILRDLVFRKDGTVRPSFGLSSIAGKATQDPVDVRKKPMVFKKAALDYDMDTAETRSPISSLIVALKAHAVLPAIRSLRHRLSPNSTIVLLSNGMGIYEEVVSELYRNAVDRPHFILGVVTHGTYMKGVREVIHATREGWGSIRWGIVPDWRGRDFERSYWESESNERDRSLGFSDLSNIVTPSPDESSYDQGVKPDYTSLHQTAKALLGLKDLGSKWKPISQTQLLLRQKLAVNCVINPLTGLLNIRNGELFAIPHARKICTALCAETAAVFAKEAQAQGEDPRYDRRPNSMLQAKELEYATILVGRQTAHNQSSMMTDLNRGSATEIGYMNEYLVRLGAELKVPTPTHETISTLIRMKFHVGHEATNKR